MFVYTNVGMRGFEPSLGWWKPIVADREIAPASISKRLGRRQLELAKVLAHRVFFDPLADFSNFILDELAVSMYLLRS